MKNNKKKVVLCLSILAVGGLLYFLLWSGLLPFDTPRTIGCTFKNSEVSIFVREDDWQKIILSDSRTIREISLKYPVVKDPHFVVSSGERFVFFLVKKKRVTALMRLEIPERIGTTSDIECEEVVVESDLKEMLPSFYAHFLRDIFSASFDGETVLVQTRMLHVHSGQREPFVVLINLQKKDAKIISVEWLKGGKC